MTDELKQSIPWVEKYRPTTFQSIVLDEVNSKIFENIIKYDYFPNLLFYGAPGTGKTTTIINLINTYQKSKNCEDKSLMIHLNASDDRGIDVIRSQINQFVNSKSLFTSGLKFVILDEADYMTKNAQLALHNMFEQMPSNVKICLICNYISKIEQSLLGEFIHIRFNKLPEKDIINFLSNIAKQEKLTDMTKQNLKAIQEFYKNDIRSMINFMQINKKTRKTNLILDSNILNDIVSFLKKETNHTKVNNKIEYYSLKYSIEKQNLIKFILKFLIIEKHIYDDVILNLMEVISHRKNDINIINNFCINKISFYLNNNKLI